jgi:hypothetical protein
MNGHYPVERRPVTPQYVLDILRDSHRQQCHYDPEADAEAVLSFDTTVAEWRDACDLLPWRQLADALNVSWGLQCTREEWQSALEPAKHRTLRDVCDLLARHARLPQACRATVLGSSCRSIGVFFTIRSLLREAGVNTAEIAPSTPLDSYTRQYLQVFLGPISWLAPGAMPPVEIHAPVYNAAFWGLLVGQLLMIVGACASLLSVALGGSAALVGALLAFASYAMAWIAARHLGPSRVAFGDLRTFRDLATVLARRDQ